MRRVSPASYENLSYADYPEKNETQEIIDEVNQQVQPKIDAKTPDISSMQRSVIHKALYKTIEKVVDKVIDKAIQKVNETTKRDKAKV
ncbi:hypothetical protein I4U23_016575 [Adineta vaga]|nr:hypothetical protein I4U23_016575 [Adineta vaga]